MPITFEYGDRVTIKYDAAIKLNVPNGVYSIFHHFKAIDQVSIIVGNGVFKVGSSNDFLLITRKKYKFTYFCNVKSHARFRHDKKIWMKLDEDSAITESETLVFNSFDIIYCEKSDCADFEFVDSEFYGKLKKLHS